MAKDNVFGYALWSFILFYNNLQWSLLLFELSKYLFTTAKNVIYEYVLTWQTEFYRVAVGHFSYQLNIFSLRAHNMHGVWIGHRWTHTPIKPPSLLAAAYMKLQSTKASGGLRVAFYFLLMQLVIVKFAYMAHFNTTSGWPKTKTK